MLPRAVDSRRGNVHDSCWREMAKIGDPLGCGTACTTGLPLRFSLCWGVENLENSIVRRLSTDEGGLASIGDDSDYGFNLIGQLNGAVDFRRPGTLSSLASRIRSEVEKDPRVQRATVRVIAGMDSLTVYIDGTSASGPFSLVLAVGDMTITRLNQGIQGNLT